jgi:hypothetical protein
MLVKHPGRGFFVNCARCRRPAGCVGSRSLGGCVHVETLSYYHHRTLLRAFDNTSLTTGNDEGHHQSSFEGSLTSSATRQNTDPADASQTSILRSFLFAMRSWWCKRRRRWLLLVRLYLLVEYVISMWVTTCSLPPWWRLDQHETELVMRAICPSTALAQARPNRNAWHRAPWFRQLRGTLSHSCTSVPESL